MTRSELGLHSYFNLGLNLGSQPSIEITTFILKAECEKALKLSTSNLWHLSCLEVKEEKFSLRNGRKMSNLVQK